MKTTIVSLGLLAIQVSCAERSPATKSYQPADLAPKGVQDERVETREKALPTTSQIECLKAEDAEKAVPVMAGLAAGSSDVIKWIEDHLPMEADKERVQLLIRGLEDDAPEKRERAFAELASLGPLAEQPLKRTLAAHPPPETRSRVENLLAASDHHWRSACLFRLRLISILGWIGGERSHKTLKEVTDRSPSDRERAAARAALNAGKANASTWLLHELANALQAKGSRRGNIAAALLGKDPKKDLFEYSFYSPEALLEWYGEAGLRFVVVEWPVMWSIPGPNPPRLSILDPCGTLLAAQYIKARPGTTWDVFGISLEKRSGHADALFRFDIGPCRLPKPEAVGFYRLIEDRLVPVEE